MLTVIFSCSPESTDTSTFEGLSADAKGKVKISGNQNESLDVPILSCGNATKTNLELIVTAGTTGAAGGFDIHWMTEADFVANGSEWNEELGCEMGFSGNGNDLYILASGESLTLNLEDLVAAAECGSVECGVTYVFRVRAKNEGGQGQQGGLNKSDWSVAFSCATTQCVCTYGLGYWKNHSDDNPGGQDDVWSALEYKLGEHTYTRAQWNQIFDSNNKDSADENSNGLVIFAQHLMAAKLNVANGAGNSEIENTISSADALIGDHVLLEDNFTDGENEASKAIKTVLESFNESSPCSDEEEEIEE